MRRSFGIEALAVSAVVLALLSGVLAPAVIVVIGAGTIGSVVLAIGAVRRGRGRDVAALFLEVPVISFGVRSAGATWRLLIARRGRGEGERGSLGVAANQLLLGSGVGEKGDDAR